jgi:hypothetical protein
VVGRTAVGRLLLAVAFLGGMKLEAEMPNEYEPGRTEPDNEVGA